MNLSKNLLFPFSLLLYTVLPKTVLAATDVLFVIDSSGSMSQVTGGKKQIDAAREAVKDALREIPTDAYVGVRAYAHRVEQIKKEESCHDTETIIPMGTVDQTKLSNALSALSPKGYTPIAYSLDQARGDFSVAREAEKVIVLLSDGEETCGGDPVAVVKKLKADGFKVTVHAVGFNVDDKARAQLQAVASAGEGKYFDAKSAEELKAALGEATKESFLIEKKSQTLSGKAVRGGDGFDTAVTLPLNEDLKLDHHQKKNEYDYFYVELQPGQELQVELRTLEKGLSINGEKAVDNTSPYAGFRVMNPDRGAVTNAEIIGTKFKREARQVAADKPGKYYVAIGSAYDSMHKDQVQFLARIVTKGDVDTESDAGDTVSNALPIEAKRYQKSYLGGADEMDTFSFVAKAGQQYQLLLIPGDKFSQSLRVRILDEVKRVIATESAPTGQGIKSKPIAISDDGTYYLEITSGGSAKELEDYTIELRTLGSATEGASPTREG